MRRNETCGYVWPVWLMGQSELLENLAHHRFRQGPHLLQSLHPPQGQPRHRQVPLRRRPQGSRPPDPRRVQQVSGEVRRGKHQYLHSRPAPALRRLRRQGYRHHHSEARPCPRRNQ